MDRGDDATGPMRGFVLAMVVGTILTWGQAQAVGGPDGMLLVGENSTVGAVVEEQLGPVVRAPGSGHDGQITFAIATDLTGDRVPELLDHAGYRYRRILLPALASGFGVVGGWSLMWSLLAWNILSFGIAAWGLGALLQSFGRSWWGVFGVLGNPGLWLSINLVTPDVMAAGFALAGLGLASQRRYRLGAVAVALALLAKDQYVVVSMSLVALMLLRRRLGLAALFGATVIPVAAWSLWVDRVIGQGFTPRSNFDLPFRGILESLSNWDLVPASDVGYSMTLIAVVALATTLLFKARNRVHLVVVMPWIAMALVASSWVWQFGNNAVRAFAPLFVWIGFALARDRQPPVLEGSPANINTRERGDQLD